MIAQALLLEGIEAVEESRQLIHIYPNSDTWILVK